MNDPAPAPDGLRRASRDDIARITAIHLEVFPGFFLTFLGRSFLHALYHGILEDETGVILVHVTGGEVDGFVAGAMTPAALYGRLAKRHWLRFGLAVIQPTLRRPVIIPRLLRAFNKPAEEEKTGEAALLMSLAVAATAQRRGLGRKLVDGFATVCATRGLRHVRLTTDRINNDQVNFFYQGCGFRVIKTFITPEGRSMNEYRLDLPNGVT